MVFSQSENVSTDNTSPSLNEYLVPLVPDMNLLSIFQAKEEELDALGASRSRFTNIEKKLLEYQNIASQRREYQEKALGELRTLQSTIKSNLTATELEKKKLEQDIATLEAENGVLAKKQEETKTLLKKFYQQGYIREVQWDQDVTFMSLLLPKSFWTSIKESEILDIMKVTSQGLIHRQQENQKKISEIQTALEFQKNQRIRTIARMDQYNSELATTAIIEAELLWKTISRQWAIQNTLKNNQKNTKTLTEKFEQKFAEYEKDIQKYSEQYKCSTEKSAICTWILSYTKAEKSLRLQEERISSFVWPISVEGGFGFHFRDQKYHNIHQQHHTGIDIFASDNAPVSALNDGYIIATKKATTWSPGLLIMKHRDGFMTVYKNIRPKKDIQLFSIIKKWDNIGTVGTSKEHSDKNNLHIEMYLRGILIDPMEKMSLETSLAKNVPNRYGWKYIDDLKKFKKEVDIPALQKIIWFFYIAGENELERQKNMIEKYAGTAFRDQKMWIEESISESVDPSFVLCVWFAESTLGQNLTTPGNIGNVWNTDSGDRRDYDGPRAWVRAIAAVVNNRWLGHYETIDQLSGWGNPRGPIYASSPTNWHENIVKCMSALKGRYIGNYSTFRLNAADLLSYEKAGYKRTITSDPEATPEVKK